MRVTVHLPDALRAEARGRVSLELSIEGDTVRDVLAMLSRELPAVYHRVADERSETRPHINVFVDGEDIRWTGGLATPVENGAELHIIPAVSGG